MNEWPKFWLPIIGFAGVLLVVLPVVVLWFGHSGTDTDCQHGTKEIPCEKRVGSANSTRSYTYKTYCVVCEEVKVRE